MDPLCTSQIASYYPKPSEGIKNRMVSTVSWIQYRGWNAAKHIFHRSDWDVEKNKVKASFSESMNSKCADAFADLILFLALNPEYDNKINILNFEYNPDSSKNISRYRLDLPKGALHKIFTGITWVQYRVWNAVKHVFGQSAWDLEKAEIKKAITVPINSASSDAFAEFMLSLHFETRAKQICGDLNTHFKTFSLTEILLYAPKEKHIEYARLLLSDREDEIKKKLETSMEPEIQVSPFISGSQEHRCADIPQDFSEDDLKKTLMALRMLLAQKGYTFNKFDYNENNPNCLNLLSLDIANNQADANMDKYVQEHGSAIVQHIKDKKNWIASTIDREIFYVYCILPGHEESNATNFYTPLLPKNQKLREKLLNTLIVLLNEGENTMEATIGNDVDFFLKIKVLDESLIQ